MPTRNVVLTDHQQQFLESMLASGRYQNASEVLREGLRLVEQRESEDAARLAALRDATAVAWEDVAAGRYVDVADSDLDDFLSRLDATDQPR
ncbi:MAG: type II toxin-antitoxin system ParD family antitoxin [Micrococcales bacterium]|nr:type II toxin-antitoxin system ParD family antitoxin [Micrococcales bacterium]